MVEVAVVVVDAPTTLDYQVLFLILVKQVPLGALICPSSFVLARVAICQKRLEARVLPAWRT